MNWLEWQPPTLGNSQECEPTKPTKPTPIIENSLEHEPTKPSEPSFDGFDGSFSGQDEIIDAGTPKRWPRDRDELFESMRRLESTGINIAVCENGGMHVVVSESDTLKAIDAVAAIYSPRDMYYYIQLEAHDRRLLHDFKKRFGGQTEWRKNV